MRRVDIDEEVSDVKETTQGSWYRVAIHEKEPHSLVVIRATDGNDDECDTRGIILHEYFQHEMYMMSDEKYCSSRAEFVNSAAAVACDMVRTRAVHDLSDSPRLCRQPAARIFIGRKSR